MHTWVYGVFSIRTRTQDVRCFEMLVCNSHTGDSVAYVSVKKSAKQTNVASADCVPPMTSGELNCANI